jgi:tripartite ATP-independent transporter DctP family solute receptor
MMRSVKSVALACCTTAALAGALTACGSDSGSSASDSGAKEVRLSLSIPDAIDSSVGETAKHFADQVDKASGGHITVTVVPNGTSFGGDQKAAVTRVTDGSLDATILSTSVYAGSIKEMNAISLPYLFSSTDKLTAYLEGQPGKDLAALLESEDKTKALALMTRTPREVTNSERPITKPEDLQGLKIRVPGNPLWTDFFSSLGASPTPMDFSEVFTALQTGTIDGQENPVEVPVASKFSGVQKYLSMTNHMQDAFVLGVSDAKWNSLSPQQQEQLQAAATETAHFKTQNDADKAEQQVKELQQQGMKVNELSPAALGDFRDAAHALYPQFADLIGADFMNETTTFVDGQ